VPLAARVRIGRAAISMELRRRERGLASDMPLATLAESMGYPDVKTLLIAVADHAVEAAEIAERLIHQVDGGSVEAAVAAQGSPPNRLRPPPRTRHAPIKG
jgi:hypothetical protein